MPIKIQEHTSLKEMTTMRVGGTARYFCSVGTAEELTEVFSFIKEKKLPVIILGGGSNTLIANGEIDALVVKIEIMGIEWDSHGTDAEPRQRETHTETTVVAGAGESWDNLVAETVGRGLWGLENLSGIPGTVGASPIQNIGAYGAEIKDTLRWVGVFDIKTGERKRLANAECQFGYRDSIFKKPEGKDLIITEVAFLLKKDGVPNLTYKDLKERFMIYDLRFKKERQGKQISHLTPSDIRKAVLEIREKKFPDMKKVGTAGSFFKNPIIPQAHFDELRKRYPTLPGFPLNAKRSTLNAVKVPLAWILDNICHLKGYQKGEVALFENQPIVLINQGDASAEDIKKFADEVIACVKENTGIDIEPEVRYLR